MSAPPRIALRAARRDDRDLLLGWANDPLARSNSFDHHEIGREEHFAWLERRLSEPRTRIYVATADETPCGVVRFERREGDAAEVSVTLDARFRGRGLSAPILRAATARYRAEMSPRRIVARVKKDNTPSLLAFERAGYQLVRWDGEIAELEAG